MTIAVDRPEAVRAAAAYVNRPRPWFTRLPFDYRRVPLNARTWGMALVSRLGRERDVFPSWPIERSIDEGFQPITAECPAALLVTHDVDSPRELLLVEPIWEFERGLGIPSAWGFVPDVSWPSEALARELVRDGCEPYWHDIGHDGRLAYRDVSTIRSEFDRVLSSSPWAAELLTSFRSGQMLMSPGLLTVIEERFAVDLSIPDTERAGPYGGTAGCGTVRPFRIGGLLEIPLSLPQDVYLRHVYGMDAGSVLTTWKDKIQHIAEIGGVAVLNTHPVWSGPEQRDMWAAYRELLQWVVERRDLLITTPNRLRSTLLASPTGERSEGQAGAA